MTRFGTCWLRVPSEYNPIVPIRIPTNSGRSSREFRRLFPIRQRPQRDWHSYCRMRSLCRRHSCKEIKIRGIGLECQTEQMAFKPFKKVFPLRVILEWRDDGNCNWDGAVRLQSCLHVGDVWSFQETVGRNPCSDHGGGEFARIVLNRVDFNRQLDVGHVLGIQKRELFEVFTLPV
jgi:hypothetical protein